MEPLQKNERYKLSKTVSEQLKQYIIDQKMNPGDKLPTEREMVKQMGISRSVIREALCYLEISGIVTIQHGGGAFIQEQDLTPLVEQLMFQWRNKTSVNTELHELRIMLELNAIELAIKNGSEEDYKTMEQIAHQMTTDTYENHSDLDLKFHRALLNSTHQQVFNQIADPLVCLSSSLALHKPHDRILLQNRKLILELVNALRLSNETLAKDTLRALLNLN